MLKYNNIKFIKNYNNIQKKKYNCRFIKKYYYTYINKLAKDFFKRQLIL